MPEVGRKMKLWRDEVREREREELKGQKKMSIRREKSEGAIQTCEVAECNCNLFAATAMTGVGGRSIS